MTMCHIGDFFRESEPKPITYVLNQRRLRQYGSMARLAVVDSTHSVVFEKKISLDGRGQWGARRASGLIMTMPPAGTYSKWGRGLPGDIPGGIPGNGEARWAR